MTSVDPSGAARPLRVAGLALLGVAAVALVIGLITVFGGNGDGQADDGGPNGDQPTQTTSRPPAQTTSPSTEPPSTSQPTSPTTSPPTSSPTGSPTRPPGDGNGEPTKQVPVRVYNNSTIKGLAADAAEDFTSAGWQVAEVGNYGAGIIPETTAYYTPDTDEEAAARALAAEFGLRAEARFEGIRDSAPGVIVIVTNNYGDGGGKTDK